MPIKRTPALSLLIAIAGLFPTGTVGAAGAADASPPPQERARPSEKGAGTPADRKAAAPAGQSRTEPGVRPQPGQVPEQARSGSADAPRSGIANSDTSGGVQRLVREFGEQRNDLLDERNALLERLRLARTEEEKQRILAELRQLQQQRIEQQREKARQIREQMLGSRESRRDP